MSLFHKLVKARAKELQLTEAETRKLAKRVAKFIEKESQKTGEITDVIVLKSFFILNEIKRERYSSQIINQALASNKNLVIERYYREIVDKHNKGWGARRIAQYLQKHHKVKISHTTVYKFLKELKNDG